MANSNLIDYLIWRGDLTFDNSPLNEIDNLVFSILTYVDFTGIVEEYPSQKTISLGKAMQEFENQYSLKKLKLGVIVPHDYLTFISKACKVNRYKDLQLGCYINDIDLKLEKQFSAITIFPNKDTAFFAFRGTDDTLVGWKENLNMVFQFPTAAENEAKEYVDKVTSLFKVKRVYVGGHSKGGNLALYSGIYASEYVLKRLVAVYNSDGPGLDRNLVDKERLERVEPLILSIAPEGSVVGMLFDHFGTYKIVKSSYRGLYQHDGMSWQIEGDHFIETKTRSKESITIEKQINALIHSLNSEEKLNAVEGLYKVLQANNAKTLTDLFHNKDKYKLVQAYMKLDNESKKIVGKVLMIFIMNKAIVMKPAEEKR